MSTYLGNVWGNLKFSVGHAGWKPISVDNPWRHDNGTPLTYQNQHYKSVLVHTAKRMAVAQIEGQLNKLLPKYKRHMDKKMRKGVLEQQKKRHATLISNGEKQAEEWGKITTAEKDHVIVARDMYGRPVPEAFMLYYESDKEIEVTDIVDAKDNTGIQKQETYKTKTVCHIDLAPKLSIQSKKNIVTSQVQGRDYSRKELVSGGDLTFTISGAIVGNQSGVYPESQVKKFVQIANHSGILNVNFMTLATLGVTRMLVTGYSLAPPTFKNIQPYTLNCVAIEPDEDMQITQDTIGVINEELKLSPMNKWYKLILNNKLAELATTTTANAITSIGTQAAGAGLDKLIPNI